MSFILSLSLSLSLSACLYISTWLCIKRCPSYCDISSYSTQWYFGRKTKFPNSLLKSLKVFRSLQKSLIYQNDNAFQNKRLSNNHPLCALIGSKTIWRVWRTMRWRNRNRRLKIKNKIWQDPTRRRLVWNRLVWNKEFEID